MNEFPKVEFALGKEVSMGQFFKSSFARSFFSHCRDTKSLDYEFLDNGTITEEPEGVSDKGNNNFYSLVNFGSTMEEEIYADQSGSVWKIEEVCNF